MNTKNLTKLVGLTSLLMASTAANAGWQGNFLLGIEGGYAWRDAELNTHTTEPAPLLAVSEAAQNHHDSGFIWGILGGYQIKCNRYLFGLEANVSWQDVGERKFYHFVDGDGDHYSNNAEHERDTVYGLTFRAGYQLTPWMMPYLRAGAETSEETVIFNGTNVTDGTAISLEDDRQAVRFVGGAGVEFPLYLQSVLRLEYNYSSRGRGAAAQGQTPGSLELVHVDIKPNQHAAKLAFVWNFR